MLDRQVAAIAEELVGFVQREPQSVGVDLEQLPACAQATETQVGQTARADHQLSTARQVVEDLPHEPEHRRILDHLEIIEEQRKGCRARGQRADDAQCDVGGRRVALGASARDVLSGQPGHRFGQTIEKAGRVVVGSVERQPGRIDTALFEQCTALHHRGRLAEAGRCAHQHQASRLRIAHGVADSGAHHLRHRRRRWVELGRQQRPGQYRPRRRGVAGAEALGGQHGHPAILFRTAAWQAGHARPESSLRTMPARGTFGQDPFRSSAPACGHGCRAHEPAGGCGPTHEPGRFAS